ncbi:hypothetical protein VN12_05450 [Pirellula sp. SH-Sr6A]|nr:hypothetical protein VN12_05450 [Pirellula sp. SH-Sr6A]
MERTFYTPRGTFEKNSSKQKLQFALSAATQNAIHPQAKGPFRDSLAGPGRSRTGLSVKLIFRKAARRHENTESVLKTHNSHANPRLAINGSPRRFLIRVDPGSLSFFYGRNAKKLTPDDERSTPGVFRVRQA